MSCFPPHLATPTSRSISFNQENIDDNGDPTVSSQIYHKPPNDHASHQPLSSQSINTTQHHLPFSGGAPLIQSLRPQDVRQSVTEWIKSENQRDSTLRLVSGSGRHSPLMRHGTPVSPEPQSVLAIDESSLSVYDTFCIKQSTDNSIGERMKEDARDDDDDDDDEFVDSTEMRPDDDSLNLDGPLMALSGTSLMIGSLDDMTISGGDKDQSMSLIPNEEYVEVEPPRFKTVLAPNDTLLDLSKVEPSYKTFPLASIEQASISDDELKLLGIWDYELKQKGSPGLDLQGLVPHVDFYDYSENDDKNLSNSFWNLFKSDKRDHRYAKENPWYRIMKLIDNNEDSYAKKKHVHPLVDKDMLPIGYDFTSGLEVDPDAIDAEYRRLL
ncbi:hypothetical protein BON22_4984 [Cyberlindnera fabianii]|uniref:Uncharacterized protein n=1 Tax=Cyberlindnera fabianii TaxID=36022 RepID=A0A1V2KZV7_CYBFA|nr:hypothetical protein BON22_4984 [Cyberlindnera fabianii]